MSLAREMRRLVQPFIAVKSRMTEVSIRVFKDSPVFTKWPPVRALALGVLLFAGAAIYLNMASESTIDTGSQSDHFESLSPAGYQEKAAGGPSQIRAYPSEGFRIKADRQVRVNEYRVPTAPPETPWQEESSGKEAREAAQQTLVELGFAAETGEQFQASVAEADDAGHGQLLLEAGFTEQQIRNAQERQRKAYEEAGADAWFRLWASNLAQVKLRHQGLADSQGYVNVAAAEDAGFRDLLLHAGFSEKQLRNAQRR